MKRLIWILIIMVFAGAGAFASPEECFDELKGYYDFGNMTYEDFEDGMSSFYNLNEPFLKFTFDTPLVLIRFNPMGTNSTLRVNPWPQYKSYNFFEMYADDPTRFGGERFAGCGFMKLTPLGDYDYDTLDVNNYGGEDLSSYQIKRDNDRLDYRVLETQHDTFDVENESFLRWNMLRIYWKDDSVFFKQYEIIDEYKDAISDFKLGDNEAFVQYRIGLVNSGEDWAPYMEDYEAYKSVNIDSGIGDNTNPLSFPMPPTVTYSPPVGEQITLDTLEDVVTVLNNNLAELRTYGFISPYAPVSVPAPGDIVTRAKFEEIQGHLHNMLNVISKGSLYEPLSGDPIILESDLIKTRNNLNAYLNNKACIPGDFNCEGWGFCSGSSARSVSRNRNCIGTVPQPSVGCTWSLYSIGPTYSTGWDCSATLYRDYVYRDLFNSMVFDVCGIFNANQWMGHTKTTATVVGWVDNCGGGDGDDGGN